MNKFIIHPRLAAGGHHLLTLNNCDILLKNNAHYLWFLIVPHIEASKTEITQLSESEYRNINTCTLKVSQFISKELKSDKINIGNIGNIVQQMHIHVIGRSKTDPAWPDVVWGHSQKKPYSDQRVREIKNAFHRFLAE